MRLQDERTLRLSPTAADGATGGPRHLIRHQVFTSELIGLPLSASAPADIERDLLGADGGRDSSRAAGNICPKAAVAHHVRFHKPQVFI